MYYQAFQRAKHLSIPQPAPPHAHLAFALELAILVLAAQLLVGLARTEEWHRLVQVARRDGWDLDKAFQSAHVLLSHDAPHPERGTPLSESSENKRLIAPLFGFAYHAEKRRYVALTGGTGPAPSREEGGDANA